MNFRRQNQNRYHGGGGGGLARLSCVEEKEGVAESLASLIADGFEMG